MTESPTLPAELFIENHIHPKPFICVWSMIAISEGKGETESEAIEDFKSKLQLELSTLQGHLEKVESGCYVKMLDALNL